jgi:SAM-dependent methyltransferase
VNLCFGSYARRSTAPDFLDRGGNGLLLSQAAFWRRAATWGLFHPITAFLHAGCRRWAGGVTVLDLGCGTGALSIAVAKWAAREKLDVRIHGTDSNPALVELARENGRRWPGMTFEARSLSDPFFLRAQQFDYVVSAYALHRQNGADAATFLKVANRQAKIGFVVCDWMRDVRAGLFHPLLASLVGGQVAGDAMSVAVKRGFSVDEINALREEAGLDGSVAKPHFGLRFTIEAERALVLDPRLAPDIGLAGA